MPENETRSELRPRIVRNLALLVLYVAMTGWVFYGQSTALDAGAAAI